MMMKENNVLYGVSKNSKGMLLSKHQSLPYHGFFGDYVVVVHIKQSCSRCETTRPRDKTSRTTATYSVSSTTLRHFISFELFYCFFVVHCGGVFAIVFLSCFGRVARKRHGGRSGQSNHTSRRNRWHTIGAIICSINTVTM